jgi:hypothetical protein
MAGRTITANRQAGSAAYIGSNPPETPASLTDSEPIESKAIKTPTS